MLIHLHVKNLALIEEAEVDFGEGLNILTGETGAGKSIIIGSINFALGQKISKDTIRDNADYALIELVFEARQGNQIEKLKELDIPMEKDGLVIISRKITNGRSVSKVNGETMPGTVLKQVGEIFIDIHGQHEHQSLLNNKKHLEILDEFAKEELTLPGQKVQSYYQQYVELKKQLLQFTVDETERQREISFLQYEIQEINNAHLQIGEDTEIEVKYKKMIHGKKIAEALTTAYNLTGYEVEGCAGESIGKAVRELSGVLEYDEPLDGLYNRLNEIESLLNDFNREIADYTKDFEFSQEELLVTEERLNAIHHLKSKYGKTIEDIFTYRQEKEKRLEQLYRYEETLLVMQEKQRNLEEKLEKSSGKMTAVRKQYAKMLAAQIKDVLVDLNFLDVQFEIEFKKIEQFQENGVDSVEFLISTNPGEKVKSLGNVASGGELSRIMLAIKTVLAQKDEIDTLIFDEVDVGISGRTAQKVSEKMAMIGRNHQVICITHLPQIAAMADEHFAIEKLVKNKETTTNIRRLSEGEIVTELARILGGAEITSTVLESAREMKELAKRTK